MRRQRPDGAATPAQVAGGHEPHLGLRLDCRGVVQGVGFRPAAARLAVALGLQGCLANVPGAVRIELAGHRPALERFLAQLAANLPAAARLEPLQPHWLTPPLPAGLASQHGVRIAAAAPQPLGIGLVAPSLVADRAPCSACRRELRDPADRRCGYPFISCCSCGPRYTIATAEPFSRAHTTLAGFPLCSACRSEFEDPADRRFHAETIGCPACGPQLRLLDGAGRLLAGPTSGRSELAGRSNRAAARTDPLAQAVALLRRGAVLALQGVGGFQLLVDAADAAAVARLRQRKRRPDKPFALLVDTPGRLADLVRPSPAELAALQDPAAPIVLLAAREEVHRLALPGVAPGAAQLGVMLPASPLHLLLAEAFAGPLVATSGNRSGEPLCIEPDEAVERLGGIADAFLVHDRPVARPLDDSLLQLIDGRPALLRRARGYAPEALPLQPPQTAAGAAAPGATQADATDATGPQASMNEETRPPATLLALGSDLKSAPALAQGERLWLAPHLGDLADGRVLWRWRAGLAELLQRPGDGCLEVAIDAHPGYLSHQEAAAWLARTTRQQGRQSGAPGSDSAPGWVSGGEAERERASPGLRHAEQTAPAGEQPRLLPVAHHRAHALAVVAEHGLALPLPALVLDGLGYGSGPVPLWGCELLWLDAGGARRLTSLRPFPLPGGERAVREPRRSALGLLWAAGLLEHPGAAALHRAFSACELGLLVPAVAAGCNSPWCSSAGRLFDAVAALLDLVQIASHDAHAGLLLQAAAECAPAGAGAYPLPWLRPGAPLAGQSPSGESLAGADAAAPALLDWQPLLQALLEDIAAGTDTSLCAARFHGGLIEALAAAVPGPGQHDPAGPSGERPTRSDGEAGPWSEAVITDRNRGEAGDDASAAPAVVLAGGCFQNRLLLEGMITALRRRGLRPCWGERIPVNDGGLAAGQLLALSHPVAADRAGARR